MAGPDFPYSPNAGIRDRGNINVPNGEGSCPNKRQKSNSEDDENVCEGGREVHNVVNTGDVFFRCRGDYLPESYLFSSVLLSQRNVWAAAVALCVRRSSFGHRLLPAMRMHHFSLTAAVWSGE